MARLSCKHRADRRADLHVHTTSSDGLTRPEEVVAMAAAAGLIAIAIADHDSTDGIPAAQAAGQQHGVQVIPAIEISTDQAEAELHVLGYFIDLADPELNLFLESQRQAREIRAERILERLAELGYELEWGRLAEIAGGAVLTRPHIARAMVERGYAQDARQALRGVLARTGPAYVPRSKLTAQQAIARIRAAGGAAVLAHPGLIGNDLLIDDLVAAGLAGLEVYHPKHDPQQQRHYLEMARAQGLVVTGGSDYHGRGLADEAAIGQFWVRVAVVSELLARASDPVR